MRNQRDPKLLKKGAKAWNSWRMQHPDRQPHLAEVMLSEALLSGADLSSANLHRAMLNKALLNGTTLNFANLGGADLSEADLSWARLVKTTCLQHCKYEPKDSNIPAQFPLKSPNVNLKTLPD